MSAPVTCGTAAGGSTFVFVRLIVKLSTNWHDTTPTHVARAPCSTEALTDLIYEGLAEPRLFGLRRGSRFQQMMRRSARSGQWSDDDFDVLADGTVVGRILKVHAAPVGTPWMWTLAFGQHEDRTPTHGYAATRRLQWQRSLRAGGDSDPASLFRWPRLGRLLRWR